jgi:protease-4
MKEFFKSVLASAVGTFVAGMLSCFVLMMIIVGMVSSIGSPTENVPVNVKSGTMLVIGNGLTVNDTPENGTPSISLQLLGEQPGPTVDLYRALQAIDLAATDKNITGILITGELEAGTVQKGELRRAILDFKKSKKPVIGWVENASQGEYYLASVADKIYMHPAGEMEFKGLASYHSYYGESLKLIGVGVQVTKVGKYKSAVEPYIGDHMSEPAKEQSQLLMEGIWKKIVSEVAVSRKVTNAALNRAANDGGVFTASKAIERKLVDGALQRDELIQQLRKMGVGADESGNSFRQVSLSHYANKVRLPKGNGRIAVVYAEGEIVDGWGSPADVGGDRLAHELRQLRGDDRVKAVVLRVNSPGGSAFASDIIAREVTLLVKKKIPVIVSMGDLAASGGYYISAQGTVIMADPATITGSIGVFGLHFNYEELAKKIHLATDGIKTARYADLFEMHRAATPEEMAVVQATVDNVYEDFLKIVSLGRKMERDAVHEIAQGRVWLGSAAQGIGLVDRFGGLRDAIALAKEQAGLNQYELVQVPALNSGRENLLQKILSDNDNENPVFARISADKDPAITFLRANAEMLRGLRTLNDPKGVYLTCPTRINLR